MGHISDCGLTLVLCSSYATNVSSPEVDCELHEGRIRSSFFLVCFWLCCIFAVAGGISIVLPLRGFPSCRAWPLECRASVVGLVCHVACGTLVPQPGIEPKSSTMEARNLNH